MMMPDLTLVSKTNRMPAGELNLVHGIIECIEKGLHERMKRELSMMKVKQMSRAN